MNEGYVEVAFAIVRYVDAADDVESLLLKVFQSVDESAPVPVVDAIESERTCPASVRPFGVPSVTSPELFPVDDPVKFVADIVPAVVILNNPV